MEQTRIELDDGKYTIVFGGEPYQRLHILRYGEDWISGDISGSKAWISAACEIENLRRAMNVLDRRAPNAPEDDQTVELAVELSYKQDEIKDLREKNKALLDALKGARQVIEDAPADTWGIDASGDLEEAHLTQSWPVQHEHLHYIDKAIKSAQP